MLIELFDNSIDNLLENALTKKENKPKTNSSIVLATNNIWHLLPLSGYGNYVPDKISQDLCKNLIILQ